MDAAPPLSLILGLASVYFGWQFFEDGPLAHYILGGLLLIGLMAKILRDNGRAWLPACALGIAMGIGQAGCGLGYAAHSNTQFFCDANTGRPMSLIVGVLAIMAAVMTIRGKK